MKTSLRNFGRILVAPNARNHHLRFTVFIPQLISNAPSSRIFHSSIPLNRKKAGEDVNTRLYDAAGWHTAPTVSVVCMPPKGGQPACYGIYWGDDDPMNVLKTVSPSRPNTFHASIDGVLLALRQALHERKLDKVLLRTDSEYLVKCATSHLSHWRANGYKKKDGESVKNKEDLQDLDNMLSQIEVKFDKIESPIEVFNKLKNASNTNVNVEEILNNSDAYDPSFDGQTVFVHGKYLEKNDDSYVGEHFKMAAYGVCFQGNKQFDFPGRMGKFPYTLFRAQLFGILKALQFANSESPKLKNFQIVCDSPIFVKYYKKGWKKSNGEPVANNFLYKQIVKLADELNVSFRYLPEDSNHPDFKNAKLLAQDGLGMPLMEDDKPRAESGFSRDTWIDNFFTKHEKDLAETAEEWKDVPQIHAVKYYLKDSKNYCTAVFDQSSDNYGNAFSVGKNIVIDTLKLLIPLLEKKIEEGATRLVLRTDVKRIALSLESFLKKWETKGYVTAQGSPVKDADVYKQISKLLKKINLRIECFAQPEQELDKKALEYCKEEAEKKSHEIGAID
uniref:RNase H type-1 domain-containing protein n=1 Tax=Panagrolaimus sp. ES5 TaxID=591445 RepID=A0AC34FL41_9BILA